MDMKNPKDNVQEKIDDSSPKILNQGEYFPDKEEDEDEDHSMFDIPVDPREEEEDDANPGGMPTKNQTLGTYKDFKTHSTSTTATFSLEELETLNKNKPSEHLKVIMSTRGSSTEKLLKFLDCFWWSFYK